MMLPAKSARVVRGKCFFRQIWPATSCGGASASSLSGTLVVLVRTVTAISVAVVTCQLLGVFGLLTGVGVTIAAIGGAVMLRLAMPRGVGPDLPRPPRPRAGRALLLDAVGLTVLTTVHWAGPVLQSHGVGIYRQDRT